MGYQPMEGAHTNRNVPKSFAVARELIMFLVPYCWQANHSWHFLDGAKRQWRQFVSTREPEI